MCMFCAALPATAALGAAAQGEKRKREKEALGRGESFKFARVPVGALTGLVVVVLVIVSTIYHSHHPA